MVDANMLMPKRKIQQQFSRVVYDGQLSHTFTYTASVLPKVVLKRQCVSDRW